MRARSVFDRCDVEVELILTVNHRLDDGEVAMKLCHQSRYSDVKLLNFQSDLR